jgi:lipoprotein-anchoring transpeptidase ErfK/SrfK
VAHAFPRPLFLALGLAAAVGAWLLGQVAIFDFLATPTLETSVARLSGPARPDVPLSLHLQGAGVGLDNVRLFRASGTSPETAISVQPRAQDPDDWTLVAPDGGALLRPDGDYRLVVTTLEPRPALPMPRTEAVEREFRFTTVAAPAPELGGGPVKTRWATPFSIDWSLPMASVDATITPSVPLRTWVDPQDPRKTWFLLGDDGGAALTAGQTYQVQLTEARSADGLDLQQPVTFAVATPMRPRLLDVPESVVLQLGDDLELKASTDLADVRVEASDDVDTEVKVDHDTIVVSLPEFSQGMDFDLTVAEATSTDGAPLPRPVTIHVRTPTALDPPAIRPGNGVLAPPTAHPSVTFAEAIADQDAAVKAIKIEPAIRGTWKWTAPSRVELVPTAKLPTLTSYKVTVRGGPDGPRSKGGGYLEDDVVGRFQTTHDKLIDVSLDRQQVTLVQDGQAIRTLPAATGVAAAPTPVGDYAVQYHMAVARFVGTNPDGSHYDIPDVHWVLAMFGDYTIHGAYWRGRFGVPGSDGCVSMSDADAKVVFDWADDGTPIHIHH